MQRKYYLIDTENVGDRWIDFIENLREEEVLVVFYTKNHSKLLEENYLKQRYNQQIRWVECMVGSNALDHQLMGVLSYLIATHAEASYWIFSNDTGYQNVVDFWKQRNVNICTVGFTDGKKKEKKESPAAALAPEPALPLTARTSPGKTAGTVSKLQDISSMSEEEKLTEIAKAIPTDRMSEWYGVLVALMGQEIGRGYYMQLKEHKERREELSRYLIPDARARGIYLIQLLYVQNRLDPEKAAEAYKIVSIHSSKNKKAIKADFDKRFGKKDGGGTQYYKVIKPMINLLKGK